MANKKQVELILAAKNRTNKSFDRVNKNIITLEKHSKRIKSLGNIFAGFAVGVGVISSFKTIIGKTREQEAALAQLDARLKSTGGVSGKTSEELQTMASALQSVTTFGDEAILSMQSVLLTFTKIEGDRFNEATEAILDMSIALKTDLKSASIQVGKALNDPIRGVTALSRAGVQFSDDQREMIKSLVEAGEAEKAQGIILDELKVQFGGAAKAAADTFGGALEQLSNALGDLLEADGDGLVDAKNDIQELTKILESQETKDAFNRVTTLAINMASSWGHGAAEIIKFDRAAWNYVKGLAGFGDAIDPVTSQVGLLTEKIKENNEEAEKYGGAYAQNLREENKELQEQIDLLTGVKQVTEEVKEVQELLTENDLDIFGGVEVGNEKFSESVDKVLEKLEEERHLLTLSAKEQFIYNQVKKAGTDATYEEINAIKKAAEALFDEKEAIKEARKQTRELKNETREYRQATQQGQPESSVFGQAKEEAEELTKKTEEATQGIKDFLSASSQGGNDTSDAFNPLSMTPEEGRQYTRDLIFEMQDEANKRPIQIPVLPPKLTTKNTGGDTITTSSSFSKVGGLNSGLSSASISRQAVKQGSKS